MSGRADPAYSNEEPVNDPKTTSHPTSEGYRPDPATETAMTIDAFFNALVEALPDEDDLADRLRCRHEELLDDQQHRVIDEASAYNLSLTLSVLAAYQELGARHEDDELVPLLTRAFVEPMQPFVYAATRAALDGAADPFATMVGVSKDRERDVFGVGFGFSHPDDDRDRYTAEVTRCYYHDVLSANGAGQLTPIFCAFDSNWINAIEAERDGLEFERPTTIGTGGDSCPFRFRRIGRTGR
jgi:hypothetical protein